MRLFKKVNGYYAYSICRGHLVSLKTKNKLAALRQFNRIKRSLQDQGIIKTQESLHVNLSTGVREYLDFISCSSPSSTFKAYTTSLNYLMDCLGNIPLESITLKRLEKFRQYISVMPTVNSTSTINMHLRHVKAFLNKVREWDNMKGRPT